MPCKRLSHYLLIMLLIWMPSPVTGADYGSSVTPTDVWYLAKAIDDSLVATYNLTSSFEKKRISGNLRPRNVYEKVLTVADEFNTLHRQSLDTLRLEEAGNMDSGRTGPADVFRVLSLIREYLLSENMFMEYRGEKKSKTPTDVFQMLRQMSFHHVEIADQKNLKTDWATPAQVYSSVVMKMLPAVTLMAEENGVAYESYPFPKQPVSGVLPLYVYRLLSQTYINISESYRQMKDYEPITLEAVNDCDPINPADVFDLVQIISAELKAVSGNKRLSSEMADRYRQWKGGREKIVPGDVFRLIQYNFILSKRILEGKEGN